MYGVRFAAEKTPDGLREQLAAELTQKGPEAMYAELQAVDPEAAAAIHPNNHVRVLRALEHYRATGKKLSEQKADSLPPEKPYRSLILGLDFPERAQLYRRIDLRVDLMMEQDLLNEAKRVGNTGTLIRRRPRPSDTKNSSPTLRGERACPLCGEAETGFPQLCQAPADLVPPHGGHLLAGCLGPGCPGTGRTSHK